jgi:hypothetical protein
MVRQRIYGILADYEDQNDHDTLRSDPVFKLIADRLPDDPDLASQPTLSRFENAVSIPALWRLRDVLVDLFLQSFGTPPHHLTLDINAFDDPAHGQQQAGELFPRVGFVVTNLKRSPERVVKFYNGRGTAEQWIKEGKNALKWTRISCRRFKDNQAWLQLFILAYNLGNFLRQLALLRPVRTWTLTTLREKLIKIGAKVVSHAKGVTFQMAEVAVPRALLAAILGWIGRLSAAPSSG